MQWLSSSAPVRIEDSMLAEAGNDNSETHGETPGKPRSVIADEN
jgi:hypothetical protein